MPWNMIIPSFSKNSKFCKQEIHTNDHIIDIHVNTEVLTTGLVMPSGTKRHQQWHRPSGVNSYQWYQDYNLVRQTCVSST